MNETELTFTGYRKLKRDLGGLKKRRELLLREIAGARDESDLRENAKYDSATEQLGEVIDRITEIVRHLSTARVVNRPKVKRDAVVQIGMKVTLWERASQEEYAWILVSQLESDPASGRLSVDAPLAHGLLGHEVGEEVKIDLPVGRRTFQIMKIESAT